MPLTTRWVLGRDWMLHAECAHAPNPDMWFPKAHNDPAADTAAAVCLRRCAVWQECAAYALCTQQSAGIHAGVLLNGRPGADNRRLQARLEGVELAPCLLALVEGQRSRRKRPSVSAGHNRWRGLYPTSSI
ncbi:WhiB family transcriptional regulator [Nocardia sp. NBC_00565]|uniref:WhiB family transcriptional regulator n=1 Tax=Nocardia sp. NBC_00565 TaxID=2975993 RepID=UPI002E8217E8|nr:WhiB family transcriptional regulator [Nocardia sp. NBC_00565]WUC05720.1 WhiB family transcriptional regulator [Nocardia sp. NBC_00565]